MFKTDHYSVLTFLVLVIGLIGLLGLLDSKIPHQKRPAIRAFSFGVIFSICLLEFGLRIIMHKELSTHPELKTKNIFIKRYKSIYDQGDLSHMYQGVMRTSSCFEVIEFQHCRNYNELGIPHDKSIDSSKSSIIFLGDSFTEGIGATQDASMVAKFNLLTSQKYNCINAGMGGSDLFFQWKLYQNKLKHLDFKAIVFLLNSTDVYDVSFRGGDERFGAESVFVKKPPYWEPLFASSYICRQICKVLNIDSTLESYPQRKATQAKAIRQLSEKLVEIQKFGADNQIQIFYILHPLEEECISGKFIFPELTSMFNTIPNDQVINTLPLFSQNGNCESLYWKIDGHFNELGYQSLAELIYERIGNQLLSIE